MHLEKPKDKKNFQTNWLFLPHVEAYENRLHETSSEVLIQY